MCPEGPELARSRDILRSILFGRSVIDVEFSGRYEVTPPRGHSTFVTGLPCAIEDVDVKGKFMWWTCVSKDHSKSYVCTTYGMSGQWTTEHEGQRNVACRVVLDDGTVIKFVDPRRFGTISFVDEEHLRKKVDSLGPDMLNAPPAVDEFITRIRSDRRTVCESLMDQTRVSGVGNYVKCESLYLAGISPHRVSSSLTDAELIDLHESIITVMRLSYEAGGASVRTYNNVDGRRGLAQDNFIVYGKKNDFMDREVVRERTRDGRTTHWVPGYQK